ncbi:hypothetical protein D3C87_1469240 [compost metagenome]
MARPDAATRIRRRRARPLRALRAVGRIAGRGGTGVGALDRRPPERALDPEIRLARATGVLPAAHLPRRRLLLHRYERTRGRVRPGRHPHPRGPNQRRRRRLALERQQDLDDQRAPLALHDCAGPHVGHRRRPPSRLVATDRGPVAARRDRAPHSRPDGRCAFLGSVLRQRRTACRCTDRRGRRGLGAGEC